MNPHLMLPSRTARPRNLFARFAIRLSRRRALAEVERFDNRMLRDMGVTRADLEDLRRHG